MPNRFTMSKTILRLLSCLFVAISIFQASVYATSFETLNTKGVVADIQVQGLRLIEKVLVYSAIETAVGEPLSPVTISNDIKTLYEMSYFSDISVKLKSDTQNKVIVIFQFVEKPRIQEIQIIGNKKIGEKKLRELLKVFSNNMVNISKIKSDIRAIKATYQKSGYLQTQVSHELVQLNQYELKLVYRIKEKPRVYLTEINFTGTKFFLPIDLERRLQSAEIDCFSWFTNSGVFQVNKLNTDLQIILQTYLQNGFIRAKIDKPRVKVIQNKDYSRVVIDINITEGDQYYTGNFKFKSKDNKPLLFDDREILNKLELKTGEVYNPYKKNRDEYMIGDIYSGRGYAFSRVYAIEDINDETKVVDVSYQVFRGEKAYIGRIEIQGNYDTKDEVIRRELKIFDDELFNGVKIRESKNNINRLGFFTPGTGIVFNKSVDRNDQTLDYNIQLEETVTGSFNGGISYADYSGLILILSVAQKNLFGTGKSAKVSAEYKETGENMYNFSLTTPYWLDTLFTNSFSIYSQYYPYDNYNTRTLGASFGLSYPIWNNWRVSSRLSWNEEKYEDIDSDGEDLLDGVTENSYRSLLMGISYSTVNNPITPSNGFEVSFYARQYGGPLGGTTEYREYTFVNRYFNALNEDETVVFAVLYNQGLLVQTNPNKEIPTDRRYQIGGIDTVHGFDWGEITGPSSGVDIAELYPYQGDYSDCDEAGEECTSLSTEKHEDRVYFTSHTGGIDKKVLNVELLFPLTREGRNLRGVIFFDAGNVWAEDRMYEITGKNKDAWDFRKSAGLGARVITPMGVLRFEYGVKLDKQEGESSSKFDFTISGLF